MTRAGRDAPEESASQKMCRQPQGRCTGKGLCSALRVGREQSWDMPALQGTKRAGAVGGMERAPAQRGGARWDL